ncbi:hypothetical protein GCM10023337_07120 [Paenalcaligenes hermetiae]|uniref:Glycosyltransferase n=1 Tax=Paenalcaligenes hermetiae TaxID=1157987 RepID=A0ABP9LWN6_9BURK
MPPLDLRQLLAMTDERGLFQHARYASPDLDHGYCTDDNARALIAAAEHARQQGGKTELPLADYLAFVESAWCPREQAFRNFMDQHGQWLEPQGSLDSQARALWSLGWTADRAPEPEIRRRANELFAAGMDLIQRLEPLRSRAFAIHGLVHFLKACPGDERALALLEDLAHGLYAAYRSHASTRWCWWEDQVTYDNARLPQALLLAGEKLQLPVMVRDGLAALRWLLQVQAARTPEGEPCLGVIGNAGWLECGGERARWDQQPLEAYALVDACLVAGRVTGEPLWQECAWDCFRWFLGHNELGASLIHSETGGCQDGLQEGGVNRNQGAESLLAYVLAQLLLFDALERGEE